jgi:hypothetical protein
VGGGGRVAYQDITTDTYWKQATFDFTALSNSTVVYLTKNTSTVGTVLWDEARLYELESASGDTVEVTSAFGTGRIGQTNLVTNGDFNSGTTGWTAQDCTLASVAGGQDGNCLQLTRTGGSSQYAEQTLISTITIGKTYQLSGLVKSGSSGNEAYNIALNEVNVAPRHSIGGTTGVDWIKYRLLFAVTATVNQLALTKLTATPGTMLFDQVELYEIAYPTQYAPYSVGTLNSEAKAFRAINISQSSEQRAKITAIEYDAEVYADDLEVSNPDIGDDWIEPVKIKPVTNLRISEVPSVGSIDNIGRRSLLVSFSRPENDFNYRIARIWYKFNRIDEIESDETWALLQETSGTNAAINDVLPNYRYTVCVTAVSKDNIETLWEEAPKASIVVSDSNFGRNTIHDLGVSGLTIVGNPNSVTFVGNDCDITWNPTTILPQTNIAGGVAYSTSLMETGIAFTTSGRDSTIAESYQNNPKDVEGIGVRLYESPNAKGAGLAIPQSWFKDYEVKVYDFTTGRLLRTEYVTDNFYTYTYDKNFVDNTPNLATKFQIEVRARDTNLNSSSPVSLIAYNPNITITATTSSEIEDKSVTIAKLADAAAGGFLAHQNDAEVTLASAGSWTKAKETRIARAGEYRITFEICRVTREANGRIYRNGVAVGTARLNTTTNYVSYSEDISGWAAGDLCQIYMLQTPIADGNIKVRNLRILELAPLVHAAIT